MTILKKDEIVDLLKDERSDSPGANREHLSVNGDFRPSTESRLDTIVKLLDEERYQIALEAKVEHDLYLQTLYGKAEDEAPCYVWPRLQIIGRHISLTWRRYFKMQKGSKLLMKTTEISKGRGITYKATSFKKEPAWAVETIMATEESLKLKRQRAESIIKIENAIKTYRKLAGSDSPQTNEY